MQIIRCSGNKGHLSGFIEVSLSLMVALNYCALSQEESQEKTPDEIVACLSETGNDTLSVLNECEGKCLNYAFQDIRGSFDFIGEKMAFFRGEGGTIRTTKKSTFGSLKDDFKSLCYIPRPFPGLQFVLFNEDEAKQIGYDAVIFVWCKKGPFSKIEALRRIHPWKWPIYLFSRLSY